MKKLIYYLAVSLVISLAFSVFTYAEVIDFESLPAGTIIDEVYGDMGSGPIFVHGTNPLNSKFPPDLNAAVIFDSANPASRSIDIGSPNETCPGGGPGIGAGGAFGSPFENCSALGNILIVASNLIDDNGDGLVDVPIDIQRSHYDGVKIAFDFSALGSVTAEEISILDMDGTGPDPRVELFDAADVLIDVFPINNLVGDNGLQVVSLGSNAGVVKMVVHLQGSGAISSIEFTPPCEGKIGDFVWFDENQDGCQDPNEGIEGVTVCLYENADCDRPVAGTFVDCTETGPGGFYLFENLECGKDYEIEFVTPDGLEPTKPNQECTDNPPPGDSDENDSDCEEGKSVCVSLGEDTIVEDLTIDCGYVPVCDLSVEKFCSEPPTAALECTDKIVATTLRYMLHRARYFGREG